jgi:hypothetical protein
LGRADTELGSLSAEIILTQKRDQQLYRANPVLNLKLFGTRKFYYGEKKRLLDDG